MLFGDFIGVFTECDIQNWCERSICSWDSDRSNYELIVITIFDDFYHNKHDWN